MPPWEKYAPKQAQGPWTKYSATPDDGAQVENYTPPISPEQQAENVAKAKFSAMPEREQIGRALLPRSFKAEEEGAGMVRKATAGALDALSLPGRTIAAQSTQRLEGTPGASFLGMGGSYNAKPSEARYRSATPEALSMAESMADTKGKTGAGQIVRDPALIPSLMVPGGGAGYVKTALSGLKSGLVSAGMHQADKKAQGESANLGEAATEVAINTATPVVLKWLGRTAAKVYGGAKTLLSRFAEIDEDALKAASKPENLAKAREVFAATRGSLASQAEDLRGKVKAVSLNDEFNLSELNRARKAELEREILTSRPGEPLGSRIELSPFAAGQKIEDAATAARKQAGKAFGEAQDEILVNQGVGASPLTTRSGLADVGALSRESAGAATEAKALSKTVGGLAKDVKRTEALQQEAAKNLGVSANEIKWLKKNETDFGWWYDEAKDRAAQAAKEVKDAGVVVQGQKAKLDIASAEANQASARAKALKQEYITLDAADELRNTGDFVKAAKAISERHKLAGDELKGTLNEAYSRLMSDRPINALEDAASDFLKRAGVGVNGKPYGVIGNNSIPEGTVNEIRKFQSLFKTAENVRDGLDQLRLIDDRINFGGPNSSRLFSSSSSDGIAIKMFRDEIAQTLENQIEKIDPSGNLAKAWVAHREAFSKTADALDMVRDGLSTRTGNQETYFARIKNIGVKNLRELSERAKDDPNVSGVFNELRKGFYDNLISQGVTPDGFDHKLVKAAWDGLDRDLKTVMLPYRVVSHIDDVLEKTAPVKMGVNTLEETYPVLRNENGLKSALENVGSKRNEFNMKSLVALDDLLGLQGKDRFSEVAKDFYLGHQLGLTSKGELQKFTGSRTGSRTAGMLLGGTIGAAAGAAGEDTRNAGGMSTSAMAGMITGIALQSPAGALAAYKMLSQMQKLSLQTSRSQIPSKVLRPMYNQMIQGGQ